MKVHSTVEILNLIYKCLEKNKKGMHFDDIWSKIVGDIDIPNLTRDEVVGELYADLVLDHRFMITKEGLWNLKQNIQYKELQKQYDYVDNFSTTDNLQNLDTDAITGTQNIKSETSYLRDIDAIEEQKRNEESS